MAQATSKASSLFLGEANTLCGKAHPEDGVSHQQGQLGSCGVLGGGGVVSFLAGLLLD